jgi:hypothetical protein
MRQTLLFLVLLILLPVSQAVQDLLPGIPPSQERLQLLPVVFCFGVLALPLVRSLIFALAAALVQGLSLIQIQSGQAEFGLTLAVVFFISWAILLQMTSEATHGMRWEIHALGSGLVTISLLAGEFLVLSIKRGGFPIGLTVLLRIAVPAAGAVLASPIIYFSLRNLVPIATEEEPRAASRGATFTR